MKRIKEIIGVLLLVTGIACTEDKGNYNYTPISVPLKWDELNN